MDNEIKILYQYYETKTKNYLNENFSKTESENFSSIFKELFVNNAHLMPDNLAKRHGLNSILVLTLDELLKEQNISLQELKEHTLAIYKLILGDYFNSLQQDLEESDEAWMSFLLYVKKGNRLNYENKYFNLEIKEEDDYKFSFNIKKCLYYEILEKNKRPVLGSILCELDFLLTQSILKWVKFERKTTIASGESHCAFRYKRIA